MNRKTKWIGCILALITAIVLVLIGSFTYTTKYKIENIDTSISPDGVYELFFNSVGEPDWPFGYSHAQLVLKKGTDTIKKTKFDVANDGAILYKDNWSTDWKTDCVIVTITGEEQKEYVTTFFFDGRGE